MNIGILRETKLPKDRRVPLTPSQCKELLLQYPKAGIVVQPDNERAFSNKEYTSNGIILSDDLSGCDLLLGIKEVAITNLIKNKTYIFFSHTAKKQAHNWELLKAVIDKKITLIDYEYLTGEDQSRLVAFGYWAGIAGAYNALAAFGERSGNYNLKPAWKCTGKDELFQLLKGIKHDKVRIVITGGGRVAQGAVEILLAAGIREVEPDKFLSGNFHGMVFTRLDPKHYVRHVKGKAFNLNHFFSFPDQYESAFSPFTKKADIMIACHYWDPESPVFFTKDEMKKDDFRIKIIADISCDINGPIPSTLRPSTIKNPVYGYNPLKEAEADPRAPENITVMAVDNLPAELPRDASEDFGRKLMDEIMPYLMGVKEGDILSRATITNKGILTDRFSYLKDYAAGKDHA